MALIIQSDVNVNTTLNESQGDPQVTSLSDGRYVVTWRSNDNLGGDQSNGCIRARVFNQDGSPDLAVNGGQDFVVNTTTNDFQYSPSVSALPGGGFFVVWNDFGYWSDGSGDAIRGRLFDPTGEPVTVNGSATDFVVTSTTLSFQHLPESTTLADGRVVVTWQSEDAQGSDTSSICIRARVFNSDGTPDANVNGGVDFVVNSTTAEDQQIPVVTALADGGFFIAWGEHSDGSSNGIRGRLFDSSGAPVSVNGSTDDFLVNTTTENAQHDPATSILPDGRIATAWISYDRQGADTSGASIRARVLNSDGTPDNNFNSGNDLVVNSTTARSQFEPEIAGLQDGSVLVVWRDANGDGSHDCIRGRVIGSDGAPVAINGSTNDFIINSTTVGQQGQPRLTVLSDGRAVVTWFSSDQQGTDTFSQTIRSTILDFNDTEATLQLSGGYSVTLAENIDNGSVAGILTASHTTPGITFAFSATVLGEAGAAFEVVNNSGVFELRVKNHVLLDYEGDALREISVEAIGSDGDHYFEAVTINLTDVSHENVTGTSAHETIRGGFGSDIIRGGDGNDTLYGGSDTDYLYGEAGADVVSGGAGNDWLYGGPGSDKLQGGTGFDVANYLGSTSGVNVDLTSGVASGGYASGDTLTSVEGVRGSGYSDVIVGTGGNNWLAGASGSDTLTGGAGNDSFVFHTKLGATNVDRITDFNAANDTIKIDNAIFKAFAAVSYGSSISADAFNLGAGAKDASDRIIYDQTTGALLYDADGNGAGAAVQFATLSSGLTLTNEDFIVI